MIGSKMVESKEENNFNFGLQKCRKCRYSVRAKHTEMYVFV